jgi:hypothetical protein
MVPCYGRETTKNIMALIVLSYHPTWHLGTVAAIRFGTLHSLLSEAVHALV